MRNFTPPAPWRAWYEAARALWPTSALVYAKREDSALRTMLPAVMVRERPRAWVFPPTHAEASLSVRDSWRMWYVVPLEELPEFATASRVARERWRQIGLTAPRAVRQERTFRQLASKVVAEPWPAPWTAWAAWGDVQVYELRGLHYAVVGRGDQLGTVELPGQLVEPRRGFWRWQVPPEELDAFRRVWRAARGLGWHTSLRRWAIPATKAQRRWQLQHEKLKHPLTRADGIGFRRRGRDAIRSAYARLKAGTLPDLQAPAPALPDLLWGMQRAYARSGCPQLVRYPWPEAYAAQFWQRTVALYWTPAGYELRGATPAQTAWRVADPRAQRALAERRAAAP